MIYIIEETLSSNASSRKFVTVFTAHKNKLSKNHLFDHITIRYPEDAQDTDIKHQF